MSRDRLEVMLFRVAFVLDLFPGPVRFQSPVDSGKRQTSISWNAWTARKRRGGTTIARAITSRLSSTFLRFGSPSRSTHSKNRSAWRLSWTIVSNQLPLLDGVPAPVPKWMNVDASLRPFQGAEHSPNNRKEDVLVIPVILGDDQDVHFALSRRRLAPEVFRVEPLPSGSLKCAVVSNQPDENNAAGLLVFE